MKINVTARDIENGKQCSSRKCPIALAFQRVTGRPCDVSYTHIVFTVGWVEFRGRLPKAASHFVRHFDRRGEFMPVANPIEFEVRFK